MSTQTQRGKAFEYACLNALANYLNNNQEIKIEDTDAYRTAKCFYEELDAMSIINMDKGANAAAKIITRLEPLLEHPDSNSPLYLTIQEDAKGISGDVRDIVCSRKQSRWKIGISCKHNHTAVKHSRLSNTIDFGRMWFGKECSTEYFNTISPVFSRLNAYRINAIKWRDLDNKEIDVYVPLLNAFMDELRRLDTQYPDEIPGELIRYLLGRNDFYKVITNDTKNFTTIQAYNIFGTLNQASSIVKPISKVHPLALPTKFYDISYKKGSNNTIIVTCDGGWALSFRIHSASTLIEPSLKFDVQIKGNPPELHSQIEPWE